MNIGTSYVTRGAENVGVKLVNNLIRWMVLMMALLLAGCTTCPTLPGQTSGQPESLTSLPVVRGCEVGQQLPIGEWCNWAIPDGMISMLNLDGHRLTIEMDAPGSCAIQPWTLDPGMSVSAPTVSPGICNGIFELKDRRLLVGEIMRESRELMSRGVKPEEIMERGVAAVMKRSLVKLAFGEHGWTVVQAPPTTP